MRRLLLFLAISSLILGATTTSNVMAQSTVTNDILFSQMSTTILVHSNGSVSVFIDVNINNVGNDSVLFVDIRIDSLDLMVTSLSSASGDTGFTMITMERHTMITIQFENAIDANESVWVRLELQSYDLLSDLEQDEIEGFNHGSLVYYVRPHVPVSNYTLIAMLPAHASLSHQSSVPLFPEADTNFTDGERIAFKWFIPEIQPGQERAFIVRYQEIANSYSVGFSSIVLGLVGVVGVLFGLGLANLGPKLITRFRKIGEVQVAGITQEETTILDTLQMKGGSSSQKQLYTELDISESKLSLILSGLEEKGLIKRFRKGRENIVHKMERSE